MVKDKSSTPEQENSQKFVFFKTHPNNQTIVSKSISQSSLTFGGHFVQFYSGTNWSHALDHYISLSLNFAYHACACTAHTPNFSRVTVLKSPTIRTFSIWGNPHTSFCLSLATLPILFCRVWNPTVHNTLYLVRYRFMYNISDVCILVSALPAAKGMWSKLRSGKCGP